MNKLLKATCIALPLFILLVDQCIKWFTYHTGRGSFTLWFISINPLRNPGIAFSLPVPLWLQLTIIPGVVCALLVLAYNAYMRSQLILTSAYACIIGGALSNYVDRILFGGVIDYLDVPMFTVFNLADVAITIGAAMVIYDHVRQSKQSTTVLDKSI